MHNNKTNINICPENYDGYSTIITKQCTGKCKKIKSIDNFYVCSANKKDGHKNICKECLASYNKNYLEKYCEDNYERLRQDKIRYRNKNRELLNENQKIYNLDHKNEKKEYDKQRYQNKKKEINATYIIKRENNIGFKIAGNLRTRLRRAIKINQKTGSAIKDLDCSVNILKLHLESRFYSCPTTNSIMTFENYGEWHIDHIIPLSFFDLTNREELLVACNYINLRPLWAKENLIKNDKLPDNFGDLLIEIVIGIDEIQDKIGLIHKLIERKASRIEAQPIEAGILTLPPYTPIISQPQMSGSAQ